MNCDSCNSILYVKDNRRTTKSQITFRSFPMQKIQFNVTRSRITFELKFQPRAEKKTKQKKTCTWMTEKPNDEDWNVIRLLFVRIENKIPAATIN